MGQAKIIYGIDLGTTNSSIARIIDGKPKIQKSDVQKDTMPSCVHFKARKKKDDSVVRETIVGDNAYSQLSIDWINAIKYKDWTIETFTEFKRTMGKDVKYESQAMGRTYDSEELSAEVLKKLRSFVLGDNIESVVITVPAKFKPDQKAATVRAAELAGFKYCELLAEPVAASMAFGLDSKIKDGYWVVFDFGGGTFDAALLSMREGIMKVIDTEGDNFLGGKDLDYAVIDQLFMPYFINNYVLEGILSDDRKKLSFRNCWKPDAESAKIALSYKDEVTLPIFVVGDQSLVDDNDTPIEIDLTITREEYEQVASPIFQKAIDLTLGLLKRNNVELRDLASLIPVGGPIHTPLLREMIKSQLTNKADFSVDPMAVVAIGAALYASTVDVPDSIHESSRDLAKIQLSLQYESTSVEQTEYLSVKLLSKDIKTALPDKVFISVGKNNGWETGKIEISSAGEVIELNLDEGIVNQFLISLFDDKGSRIECEPDSFVILQGFKPGQKGTTLPYNIGIEIHNEIIERDEFEPIKGLEKNKSTPITAVVNNLRTASPIRPGNDDDFIEIPIYAGEYASQGTKAIYNDLVKKIRISGDDVPALIPENSTVNLTIKLLRDERLRFSAYFPIIDHTIDLDFEIPKQPVPSIEDLEEYICDAEDALSEITGTENSDNKDRILEDIERISESLSEGGEDIDRRLQILEGIRKLQREIDSVERLQLLPALIDEMKRAFFELEKLVKTINEKGLSEKYNMPMIDAKMLDFRQKISQILKISDERSTEKIRFVKETTADIGNLDFAIRDVVAAVQMDINFLKYYSNHFDEYDWKDRNKARTLINNTLAYSTDNPNKDNLRAKVLEIIELLPEAEQHKLRKDQR